MKADFLARSLALCVQARAKNSHSPNLVGLRGLEPPTSRLSGVRSNHLSYKPMSVMVLYSQTCGGDKRDRTADPLLAKQVLSQLSYTPIFVWVNSLFSKGLQN